MPDRMSASTPAPNVSEPSEPADQPPAESLLLSQPQETLDSAPSPGFAALLARDDLDASHLPPYLRPSTSRGLVLPPFPPLDPDRRKRGPVPEVRNTAGPRGVPQPRWSIDDDVNEEILIGGKTMPGWMEEPEAAAQVQELLSMLDSLDYPPFTVQRVAELLRNPLKLHSTLGKFLRALEKCLAVTSEWEKPSYVTTSTLGPRVGGDPHAPRGTATPVFSPIPFLRPDEAAAMQATMPNGHAEDVPMSPLHLEQRSETPEPPERPAVPALEQTQTLEAGVGAGPDDPSHQSYLGRVDELDTGPVVAVPNGTDEVNANSGAGEGGNMALHGMSERPVPISSTTSPPSERRIAGARRTSLSERFVSTGTEVADGASADSADEKVNGESTDGAQDMAEAS